MCSVCSKMPRKNVFGLLLENFTDSHKPVEISYLRAQSDSRSGEAGEGPGRPAEAVRGNPGGGKGEPSGLAGLD